MKTPVVRSLVFALLALVVFPQAGTATLYSDSTNDVGVGSFPNLDIVEVLITNNATHLFFDIKVNADINATAWGKYMVGIDSPNQAGGDTASNGNGWGRPINFGAPGMDYWIGSWVDGGGGAQVWEYSGSWNLTANPVVDLSNAAAGRTAFSVSLADLGLSAGQTFRFDVFSSGGGGGDGAIDSLTNPGVTVSNWGDQYTASSLSSYTVAAIPEASQFLLISAASVLSLGLTRLRKRTADQS